jgi:hypothetical protein
MNFFKKKNILNFYIFRQFTLLPNLTQGRFQHACGKVEYKGVKYLMVAGGFLSWFDESYLTSIEVLNTDTMDAWTSLESLSLHPDCQLKRNGLINNLGEDKRIFFTCSDFNFLLQDGTWHSQDFDDSPSHNWYLRLPAFYFQRCLSFHPNKAI